MKIKCEDEDVKNSSRPFEDTFAYVGEIGVCAGRFVLANVLSLSLHYGQRFVGIYSGGFNMGTGDKPIL